MTEWINPILNILDERDRRIRELEAENERLKEGLEIYADESNWNVSFYSESWSFKSDMGTKPWSKAQQAKEGKEQKP